MTAVNTEEIKQLLSESGIDTYLDFISQEEEVYSNFKNKTVEQLIEGAVTCTDDPFEMGRPYAFAKQNDTLYVVYAENELLTLTVISLDNSNLADYVYVLEGYGQDVHSYTSVEKITIEHLIIVVEASETIDQGELGHVVVQISGIGF